MDLTDAMINDGFPVCCIHSNMDKSKRDEAYTDFKAGKHRVLISSNVTSRGIDVQQVRTVLNFDLPKCIFNYLHRIGRSGRWGRKGTAINFVTRWDIKTMTDIERLRPEIEKALKYSLNTHTFDDVVELVQQAKMQFWPGRNSVVVTEIVLHPQQKCLNYFLAAGVMEELELMSPMIEAWGKSLGCTRVT
jgi:superfamily II DNA/RNA helicase